MLLLLGPAITLGVAAAVLVTGEPGVRSGVRPEAERGRAEVFAIRALADAGLYDPLGDFYTYRGAARSLSDDWELAFRRLRCGRFGIVETCRPVTGSIEDEASDAWLAVTLDDGRWHVADAEGDFDRAPATRLAGFSLPDVHETPHWEFPTVSLRPDELGDDDPSPSFDAPFLWVGPLPYKGPGSACELHGFLDGRRVYTSEHRWYVAAPNGAEDRTSGLLGAPFYGAERVDRGEIVCTPFEGAGWQPAGRPLVEAVNDFVYVEVDLVWRGEALERGESWCVASVRDGNGEVLGTQSTASGPIWPPKALDRRPIRMTKSFRMQSPRAQEVASAEVECTPN
jgi:hypothetical protein